MADVEVRSHWYHLIDELSHSANDFYDDLEEKIEEWQIRKLRVFQVQHAEGGVLSGRRKYLRIAWGEQVIDVCAAPFGRGFFVSWWLVYYPGCLTALAEIPFLGFLIRWLVKPETYFRADTRLMFQTAMHQVITSAVAELRSAGKLPPLTETERQPIMKSFFRN